MDLVQLAGNISESSTSTVTDGALQFNYKDLPKTSLELRAYQKVGVMYMLSKLSELGFVLNADDVGIGKTAQAIACAQYYAENKNVNKILIVCKKSIKEQWAEEIKKFSSVLAGFSFFVLDSEGVRRDRQWLEVEKATRSIVITNYHTFLTDEHKFKQYRSDFTIIDEAHVVKATTGIMNNRIACVNQGTPTVLLTGTPIMSSPEDVFGIAQLANPKYFGEWSSFRDEYLKVETSRTRGTFISGYKNLRQLRSKIQYMMIRRTEREVAVELPSVISTKVYCDMRDDQAIYYADFAKFRLYIQRQLDRLQAKRDKSEKDLKDIESCNIILKGLIPVDQMLANDCRILYSSKIATYRKIAEIDDEPVLTDWSGNKNQKVKACLDLVENILSAGHKVIIFSCMESSIDMLCHDIAEELKIKPLKYTGSVKEKERNEVVNLFKNSSEYNVLLGTDAMAEGLNLQIAGYVINFDQPDSSAIKTQRIGRVRRVGSKFNTVVCYDLISVIDTSPLDSEYEGPVITYCEWSKDQKKLDAISKDEELVGNLVENKGKVTFDSNDPSIQDYIKQLESNLVSFEGTQFSDLVENEITLWSRTEKEPVELLEFYKVTAKTSTDNRSGDSILVVTPDDRLDETQWKNLCDFMESIDGKYSKAFKGFVVYGKEVNDLIKYGLVVTEGGCVDNPYSSVPSTEATECVIGGYKVTVREDIDTRDSSKIWIAKLVDKLEWAAFMTARKTMEKSGGYYSTFKKGFIFKNNPIQ